MTGKESGRERAGEEEMQAKAVAVAVGDDRSWASVRGARGEGDEETLNNESSKVGGTRSGRYDTEDPTASLPLLPPPPLPTRPLLNSRSLAVAKDGR